jgi:hypothetical protein
VPGREPRPKRWLPHSFQLAHSLPVTLASSYAPEKPPNSRLAGVLESIWSSRTSGADMPMHSLLGTVRSCSRAEPPASTRRAQGVLPTALASLLVACGSTFKEPPAYGGASAESVATAYGGDAEGEAQVANMGPSPARMRAVAAAPGALTAPSAPAPEPPREEPRAQIASDAVQQGPILIYSASFVVAVYEVEKTQATLKERTKELGGFVSTQTDNQLTLRVPAERFEQALLAVEGAGKVRSRNVQASDVGDEYRDITLRLHTAELLRERLETMLAKAEKVSDALEVQAQIERIVREIEQLKGQLRGLNDRIAFSTITIMFQPEARPDLDDSDVFKLPYPWLDELGLHNLLELAP